MKIFGYEWGGKKEIPQETSNKVSVQKPPEMTVGIPTGGRRSSVDPSNDITSSIFPDFRNKRYRAVSPTFIKTIIPIIRNLVYLNADVGQALWNIVSLGNTGHKIMFDPGVSPEQVDKMRQHLVNRSKNWASGQPNMDGLVNKMFYQLLINGALSCEWVPNKDLNGIEGCVLVNPEQIEFILDKNGVHFQPYQRVDFNMFGNNPPVQAVDNLVKLNPNTYKYFALNGDTEFPHGIPPYIPVLNTIQDQKHMNENTKFVVDQYGLIGFMSVLMDKPTIAGGETEEMYVARLDKLLIEAHNRIGNGMRTGVVAGFKDDTEINFNSIAKEYSNAIELWKNNESQVASAMKQDPVLWGRDYHTSETQITVVFMKMLSEFKNLHNILQSNLEFGYSLELVLAGFKFDYLKVKFNRSTLQDDLKFQQAEEIKIRNVKDKYVLGVIGQDQMADELGYERPAESAPLVDPEVLAGKNPAQQDQITEKKKDASDKKVRSKNKPQGSTKQSSNGIH